MDFKLENRIYYSANSEEKVEVLFIMESPFVDELNSFKPCPCMGYSWRSSCRGCGKEICGL